MDKNRLFMMVVIVIFLAVFVYFVQEQIRISEEDLLIDKFIYENCPVRPSVSELCNRCFSGLYAANADMCLMCYNMTR